MRTSVLPPSWPERGTAPAHAFAASGIRPGADEEARGERGFAPIALPFPASLLRASGTRR
jgi:hypothetical protein